VLDSRWRFTTVHSDQLAAKGGGVKGGGVSTVIRHADSGAIMTCVSPYGVYPIHWVCMFVRLHASMRIREGGRNRSGTCGSDAVLAHMYLNYVCVCVCVCVCFTEVILELRHSNRQATFLFRSCAGSETKVLLLKCSLAQASR